MSTFNIIKHHSEKLIPEGYYAVPSEGQYRLFNELGLPALSVDTKYEVVAKYQRDLTSAECFGRSLLGVMALVASLGLAYLAPDVRDLFESKATIRYAIEQAPYHLDADILIKFGDPNLLISRQPFRYGCERARHLIKRIVRISIDETKQLRRSGEFEQKKNAAPENAYKSIKAVIENASGKPLDASGELLRDITFDLDSDRGLIELYLPIVNLLLECGVNTPANCYLQAEIDKIINTATTKDNMKLFKASRNPQSAINILPSDILAKIHVTILILNNPRLFECNS